MHTEYTEKYPVPAFDAATVAALMPDQRQAGDYVPHIPTGNHSDGMAPTSAARPLAAPITSAGPAIPFSRLTHTTSGHWIGMMYGGLDAYVSYVATHPASPADDVVTKPGWAFVGGGHYLANVS